MDIHFKDILPIPITESQISKKSIWKTSFTLKKGEKILLNANSGKGKTTFTEILAGIRNDYTGKVFFDEDDISTFDIKKWTTLRKDKMSFVFQDLQLFPNLTVKENLQIKNQLRNHLPEDDVLKMIHHLGIEDKVDSLGKTLSMGQQQRVAIIRALCQPFKWIILDEPFSHLDAENSRLAMSLIQKYVNQQNSGMILTTLGEKYDYTYDKELFL